MAHSCDSLNEIILSPSDSVWAKLKAVDFTKIFGESFKEVTSDDTSLSLKISSDSSTDTISIKKISSDASKCFIEWHSHFGYVSILTKYH